MSDDERDRLEADSRFNTKTFSNSDSAESGTDEAGSESEKEDGSEAATEEISDDELETETENALAMKPISKGDLSKFQARIEKTGVCYMSRIPPFMKHTKLRSMLTKYGEIGKIYLNPENPKISARRRKYKKNKRVNYIEGWIEFLDKKIARNVALLLNNTNMGGKKRSYYYDDIWNIKYLPKFKWNTLTEQLAYELKVKDQKLKNELHQANSENKLYLKNVGKAKMIEAMELKRKAKDGDEVLPSEKVGRTFKQRKIIHGVEAKEKLEVFDLL